MANLNGAETLLVLGQYNGSPAATTFQTTTQAIANLAAAGQGQIINTAINTVGAGTLTAAAIVGRVITRGGSQSGTPFSDATDTAAAIITALGANAAVGESFKITLVNNTNATQTITAGTGVTLTILSVIPQNAWAEFLLTYTGAGAVSMVGLEEGSLNADSVVSGKTLGVSNSITLAGTDATTMTFPSTSATIARTDAANTFTGTQTVGALVATTVNGNTVTAGTSTLTLAGSAQTFTSPAATDTLVGRASTDTLTNKTLTDPILTDCVASTANFTSVSTTTLATVTGLSVALTAGATYAVEGSFPNISAANAGGLNAQFIATNSLSLTSANITAVTYNGTTVAAQTNITALSSDFCTIANTVTSLTFSGTLVVNAAGTLNIQAAQHTSNGTTTTITKGALMRLTRIS